MSKQSGIGGKALQEKIGIPNASFLQVNVGNRDLKKNAKNTIILRTGGDRVPHFHCLK